MAREYAVITGCLSLVLAVFAAAYTGVGWSVLNSDVVCEGGMHTYIMAHTIIATVELAFLLSGMVVSMIGYCCGDLCATTAEGYAAVIMFFAFSVSPLFRLVTFIWGIVCLANEQCKGTAYFTMAIVFVVLNGLSIVGSICVGSDGSKMRGEMF